MRANHILYAYTAAILDQNLAYAEYAAIFRADGTPEYRLPATLGIVVFLKNNIIKTMKYAYLLLAMVLTTAGYAQATRQADVNCKKLTRTKIITPYAGLLHHHQAFFKKAFSYQGIEAGVAIDHKLLVGLYGSMFVSNLRTLLQDRTAYVNIKQCGLAINAIPNGRKQSHLGYALAMGYFSLRAGDTDAGIFSAAPSAVKLKGLVISPQAFAESG